MELLRACLFFYLLAILLSLSNSSTTNSDHTNEDTLQWKGGEGVKRSRVRRQNLHLQHTLRLPEKAYAFYMLWRLVNEIYNETNTIKPLTMRPDKLELTTSEGPKDMEMEVKPSSAPIQEQSTHSIGMTGAYDPTAMASFPTEPSSLNSQKTTQVEDLKLVEQSAQRFQTTKQKITELYQAIEQYIPNSTFKITSIAAEDPSTIAIHEQIDHFSDNNGTDSTSTTMASFPIDSLPDSLETTQSGDSQADEQSVQRIQTTKQKIIEPSEVTEQHILDSTTFTIKISSKAAEKPSSVALHEQIDHFIGINSTNNSTAIVSFPTDSLPDSHKTTQSDPQLAEESTQRIQTSKKKTAEPNQAIEQYIPDSTTFKMTSRAAKDPSTIAIHEQIDHFSDNNGTDSNSTTMASFPIDSLETTQSGDSQADEQSVQRIQTTKQKIIEPSEVTEQHILDSTTFTIKISSKAAEKPSSVALHEQIDHFIGINSTNNSTAIVSFPIDSLPDSHKTTQSDPQLAEESTQRIQTTNQKTAEPNQAIEQYIPDSTTFKMTSRAAKDPSTIAIHKQIDHFTDNNGTDSNSTTTASFPIDSLPDSLETTQSGDSQLKDSTQRKLPEPMVHSIGTTGTNDFTAIMSFPTDLPPQESQKNTQSRAPHLLKHSMQHFQSLNEKMTEPSQKILQPTALMSTSDQATTNRIQQETPVQSAIDPHIPNNDVLASTMENDNVKPTSLAQLTKNEQPKMTPVISGKVQSISKPTPPARTKQTTLSTVKPETIKNPPHTLSVTQQNGNWLVTATDWRVLKPTPPTFTLQQQIQDSTSLLQTEDSPNSDLSESTSDPEHHKPKPTEEPTNQHIEQSSRGSLMQPFISTNTQRLTYDTLVSSKTASASPLPILTENHLVDPEGPEDTSLPKGISLQDTTSFITYQSNARTQSQRTTNTYTILSKLMTHTSFPLVKDTQAPTDGVRSSQTLPISTEKLIVMFTPNTKPSEKHIHTTSVVRHGFLTPRTQENPSRISTKQSNIQPTETEESRSDLTNQGPTADSMPKENYTNNDLLTETDKQSTSGHKPGTTTRTASQKPKTFLLPTHNSANTAVEDDKKTHRDIFGLLFTFGCLVLLIIVILLRVVWRRWQARHLGNNMWVAGPPLLWGTYQSVLQNSSSHTAIQMRNGSSQKKKQENSDVYETIALKQQHKDLV